MWCKSLQTTINRQIVAYQIWPGSKSRAEKNFMPKFYNNKIVDRNFHKSQFDNDSTAKNLVAHPYNCTAHL